jgi:hypothetical protein
VVKPWAMNPSATSPASAVMAGPTPASQIDGHPQGLGPWSNIGVISVWR